MQPSSPPRPIKPIKPIKPAKAVRPTMDGRSARALRTREAIVDACIGLVEEGQLRPTAPRVAERAGVSVRSVFQHFADLPALHIAVTERIVERVAVLLHPVDPRSALDDRLPAFVRHRAALLEAITPFRRAANVHGPFAPEIQRALRLANRYLREEVAGAFQPELARVPARERREVLDGLSTALSWSAWDALRTEAECSIEQASAVTTRMVTALLAAARSRRDR
ncbi:MAG TPA: TetR/AcrR family transcriptional regulator [Acidimicrobiales bacterium]|nr:TetR/AcrR family transcriptional regulator [Acidimicrobiales bacterium]